MLKSEFVNNLSVFRQHGFKIAGELPDGKHVHGVCIFCGSYSNKLRHTKNSMYINAEIKAWDCKICGLEGGYKTFLEELYKFGLQNIRKNPDKLNQLSQNRNIPKEILLKHGVGYNPIINKFYVPVFDMSRNVADIKIFDPFSKNGFKFVSSAGGKKTLYNGIDEFNTENETIYLVEGEWDRMIMYLINQKLNLKYSVWALEGATSFTADWSHYFYSKNVVVILDNDFDREINGRTIEGAGKKGCKKIYKILSDRVKSIKFFHWKKDLQNGYDLRDLFVDSKKDCKKVYEYIKENLKDYPQGFIKNELNIINKSTNKMPVIYNGEGCSLDEVHSVFNKYLKFSNNDLIDITLASIVCNRLPGSPVWLFLVGSSGTGKSVVLMSLQGIPFIESISSLTAHTLISGMVKNSTNDPSLIPKLNGKILSIKDFTTVIGMNPTAQSEIVTTLRDSFDGHCAKPFGNGRTVRYESKFGIIAGVTQIIDNFSENLTSLGERFIRYEIDTDNTLQGEQNVLMCAMNNLNGNTKELMEHSLQNITRKFLNYTFDISFMPDTVTCRKIAAMAQITGMLRGSVLRDKRTGEIVCKPMIEYGTRLSEQYLKLFNGLHIIQRKNKTDTTQLDRLRTIAWSTMNHNYRDIISVVVKTDADINFEDLMKRVGLPPVTMKKNIDNLVFLKALEKKQLDKIDKSGSRYKYSLSKKLRELNQQAKVF